MTIPRHPVRVFVMIVLLAAVGFSAHAAETAYTLGPDDTLAVTVYGEKELSGAYKISPAGVISMPLIGEVAVSGLTTRAAEELITSKLADGYLVKPSVAIQVSDARPVYVMGEVKNPGSYKYVSNMTVLNAVALAGGYTYRAEDDEVDVTRGAEKIELKPEAEIAPGDVITVGERFF